MYDVTITGKVPLLMHADNIDWADEMDAWKSDPANKKWSKAGDDRTPAFRWLGALYHDGEHVAMPNDNLMRAFMEGGAMVPIPGGKNGKTFKAQTQSGMFVEGTHWPLYVGKSRQLIPMAKIDPLRSERSFKAHQTAVIPLGFSLYVKRVVIGNRKHVRVRPMFDAWEIRGRVHVWDEQITTDALQQIVRHAGLYKGLGDWRSGGRTPGPWGRFDATVKEAS